MWYVPAVKIDTSELIQLMDGCQIGEKTLLELTICSILQIYICVTILQWHVKYTSLQFSSCFEEVVYLQCKYIPITVMVLCITTNIWPHIRLTYMHVQSKNLSKMFTNIWICTVITWLIFTCCIPNVFSERYLILWMPPPFLTHWI